MSAAPSVRAARTRADIPVLDLRVGLARSARGQGSLAKGTGQAGYLQLQGGGVSGVLAPFPASEPRTTSQQTLSAFLTLRNTLLVSDRFRFNGCRARAAGISAWFSFEAPNELAADPAEVGVWAARGVRSFSLVAADDSQLASSALSPAAALVTGLTSRGRDVARRVFQAGALLDVSRASALSIADALELAKAAKAPLIAAHANARTLAPHADNLSDAQLKDIAASGGVIGVTFRRQQLTPGRDAHLRDVVRQILYLVTLVGSEHVALGSGFDTSLEVPVDLPNATRFPRLADALAEAGLSEVDLNNVFHGNAARLLCPKQR